MTCAACSNKVKNLNKLDEVNANVNPSTELQLNITPMLHH